MAGMNTTFTLRCASLQIPTDNAEHPNRIPFSGVVTKLDEPSDGSPSGTMGHRVIIPHSVAMARQSDLLGMPVNISAGLKSHSQPDIVGIITSSELQGSDWVVGGYLFGKNKPEAVNRIQSEAATGTLGMSIEFTGCSWQMAVFGPWTMKDGTPTGAAILYKDSAAFKTTSLAAADEERLMEALLQQLAASIALMQASQTKMEQTLDKLSVSLSDGVGKLASFGQELKSQLATTQAPAAPAAPEAPKVEAAADPNLQALQLLAQLVGGKQPEQKPAAAPTEMAAQAGGVSPAVLQLAQALLGGGQPMAKPEGVGPGVDGNMMANGQMYVPVRSTLPKEVTYFLDQHASDLKCGADGKYNVSDLDRALSKDSANLQHQGAIKMALHNANLIAR